MRIHPMKFICVGAICALSASCRSVQSAPPDAAAIARITAAAPSKAAAKPSRARRLLVFTRAAGFRHSSIETGREAMSIVGKKSGAWTTIVSDDPLVFERANLARFDAVCFLNTTGEVFLPANFDQLSSPEKTWVREREARWKKSLLDFVAGGKGFVGIHAATDTFYNWPEYGAMIGGYFDGHPWNAGDDISLRVEDPSHPIVAALKGENLSFKEEYYQFRAPYSRLNGRVLLGLDLSQTAPRDGMKRTDGDYASTWIRPFGKGRVFYSSLGHREEIYSNAKVLGVYLAGIQWAMGDLQADASALAQTPKDKTKTLFNGVNLEGWIAKKGDGPKVENGAIHITPGSGDIWTTEQFGDFVLDLEYKVSPRGNSGVFIRNPTPGDWFGGMEIQIFDSFGHNPPGVHDAGANYSVMAPSKNMSKAAGEWNTMRIRARGAKIQVELNGERVLDQDLNRWTQAGKNPDGTNNKFKKAYKDMPRVGHIELQDHGEEVWFRNIKIKELRN